MITGVLDGFTKLSNLFFDLSKSAYTFFINSENKKRPREVDADVQTQYPMAKRQKTTHVKQLPCNNKRKAQSPIEDNYQRKRAKIQTESLDLTEPLLINDMGKMESDFDNLFHQTPYQAFLNRLTAAKSRPLSHKLRPLIQQQDLNKIYDYFLSNTLLDISVLKPGEAYYLSKQVSGLPRTVNILCSKEGEFKLIVETKSKKLDGTKKKLPKKAGTTKSGKPAWRVDTDETAYFNAVAIVESDEDINDLKHEVAISQKFGSETVNENELGQKFHSKNGCEKISVYSVKADGDLQDLLSKKVALSDEKKNSMILDLLNGVKLFHDQNYVHQDLKPGNILIYGNNQTGYRLKLTDYGLTQRHGDQSTQALATLLYHSPEIAKIYSHPISSHYNYYNHSLCNNTLAKHYANRYSRISDQLRAPNKANDIWALGIIVYEILYGEKPTFPEAHSKINTNPLLMGLLAPDRQYRIDIDRALEIHNQENGIQNTSANRYKLHT